METKSMNVIEYVAPEVEMLKVQVEVGFAGSEGGTTGGYEGPTGDL